MAKGIILKALSGFYYVDNNGETVECRARGRFRREKIVPLVGDYVEYTETGPGVGVLDEIFPRKNAFNRPPVANIDTMVIIAAAVIPVTDPYLIDRVAAIACHYGCKSLVCINKCDLNSGDSLFEIYKTSGIEILRVSAQNGEGIDKLRDAIAGKVCAFTGNSGVGKSSILNALQPELDIPVGDVSEKLGRGRHTTRHVELFRLNCGAVVADTPGFASFDTDVDLMMNDNLQYAFEDFEPYIGKCRFVDCSHISEPGCAVLDAVKSGTVHVSRHKSYVRLYEQAKQVKEWEIKNRQ